MPTPKAMGVTKEQHQRCRLVSFPLFGFLLFSVEQRSRTSQVDLKLTI